jgi:negative regulator of sigma E activity
MHQFALIISFFSTVAKQAHQEMQILAEIEQARNNLSYCVQAVDKRLQLMRATTTVAPSVFHKSTILDSLTKLLQCCMDAFATPPT